jgi:hypothetical protein
MEESSCIDLWTTWQIVGTVFKVWFAVSAIVGNFLYLRITIRLSPGRTILANLGMSGLSWLLVAGFPIPVFASQLIFALFGHKYATINWLIVTVLLSTLGGSLVGVAVLSRFKQKRLCSAFWKLAAMNLLFVSIASYRAVEEFHDPLHMWKSSSHTFNWGDGQITLPNGFKYQVQSGVDTSVGIFTSPDGKIHIHHDIGGFAGHYASRKEAFYFDEQLVEGARVWVARSYRWSEDKGKRCFFAAVTFPDSDSANFFLFSDNDKDAAIIDSIARSFRPKSRRIGSTIEGGSVTPHHDAIFRTSSDNEKCVNLNKFQETFYSSWLIKYYMFTRILFRFNFNSRTSFQEAERVNDFETPLIRI